MASRPDPKRRLFLKAERVGKRRAETQRGCRRGLEGGAPWGGSPKQHPPSPVRRTHHLKRKYERPQSRPGATAPRHQRRSGKHAGSLALRLPPLPRNLPYPQLPPQARPSPSALPLQGRLPSRTAPARGHASRPLQGRAASGPSSPGDSEGGALTLPPPSSPCLPYSAFRSAYMPLDLGWRASSVHSTSTWPLRESPVLASFSSVNPRR